MQQLHTQGQQGAGSQSHHVGTRVPQILQGIHIGAKLLPPHMTGRPETLPPQG